MTGNAAERAQELAALEETALACTACALAEGRTQVVFGAGDADANLMIVGEAPGQREDEQGIPFVGPSGKLMETLLGEIGLQRTDAYIANVVKCRPPRNRDPRPEEIDACGNYLRSQLRLVDPMVVLTLGNFSSKLLLKTTSGITRLRGTAYPWWGRFLVPTFHPAAALRGSARVLEEMRHDFSLVARVISGEISRSTAHAEPSTGSSSATAPGSNGAPDGRLDPADDDHEQMELF
jgi:DNA polymerase